MSAARPMLIFGGILLVMAKFPPEVGHAFSQPIAAVCIAACAAGIIEVIISAFVGRHS